MTVPVIVHRQRNVALKTAAAAAVWTTAVNRQQMSTVLCLPAAVPVYHLSLIDVSHYHSSSLQLRASSPSLISVGR